MKRNMVPPPRRFGAQTLPLQLRYRRRTGKRARIPLGPYTFRPRPTCHAGRETVTSSGPRNLASLSAVVNFSAVVKVTPVRRGPSSRQAAAGVDVGPVTVDVPHVFGP